MNRFMKQALRVLTMLTMILFLSACQAEADNQTGTSAGATGETSTGAKEVVLPAQLLNSADSFSVTTELVCDLPRIDDNFRIMQGGCVSGNYAWFLIVSAENYSDDDNKLCYVVKYDRITMEEIGRSEPLLLGHANDATYVPETDELYVAHSHRSVISVLDAETLNIKETKRTIESINGYAIEYNRIRKNFVIAAGQGKQFIFNDKFESLASTEEQDTTLVTQGICADHKYVYHLLYSAKSNTEETDNMIFVADWNGNLVAKIPIGLEGYEPENISLVGDTFYIGCNDGEGGIVFTAKLVRE